jgi:hypothetical protein
MIYTPDNQPMSSSRFCNCAAHCSNRCEPSCPCPDPKRWCTCFCHAEEYALRKMGVICDGRTEGGTVPLDPVGRLKA